MVKDYTFRVPTPSSIYLLEYLLYINVRNTTIFSINPRFSALLAANQSRPANRRFPTEILLLVVHELHPINSVYEDIRSTWSARPQGHDLNGTLRLLYASYKFHLDTNTNTFHTYIPDPDQPEPLSESPRPDDLQLSDNGYRILWSATLQHKSSGGQFKFRLGEIGGGSSAWILVKGYQLKDTEDNGERATSHTSSQSTGEVKWVLDAIRLLNTLFGTVDGKRFKYYHPAADADQPTVDERYVAVPHTVVMPRSTKTYFRRYKFWGPVEISASDLTAFKSLLPNMKYNIKYRKVDPVNGTADLTTIVSSSLLSVTIIGHTTMLMIHPR
ncbi:hypothetical protein Clacol_002268 [Clathrus columnatus]|uniref:Uncharacterized protein n=1 Tax=Clathrus columnatus TaxID=1419009 RepID=A0AAV5A665_9AGAM|nr:hypothetical protein Clacol_002268 [Clathrus columnatus]